MDLYEQESYSFLFLSESLFLVYLVFNAKSVIINIPSKRIIIPMKYFIQSYY